MAGLSDMVIPSWMWPLGFMALVILMFPLFMGLSVAGQPSEQLLLNQYQLYGLLAAVFVLVVFNKQIEKALR